MPETSKIVINIIIAQAVFFAVIVVILKRLLLNDTMKAVRKLRQVEIEVGKKEEAMRRSLEENEHEFAQKSAAAKEEMRKAKETAERELSRMRENLFEEAKKERDRLIGDAEKNKERMRQELLREADKQAIAYAAEVFGMVFSDEVACVLNRAFVDELFSALDEVDGDSIAVDATDSNIIAAVALPDDQRERLQEIIARKFNARVAIKEKVDAALIAGLKIKLGSLEIDGSLQNRFHEAIEELQKKRGV